MVSTSIFGSIEAWGEHAGIWRRPVTNLVNLILLILKLSRNGISENLLYLLKCFLKCQRQRVLLNGQNSSRKRIASGAPQRLNDLWDVLSSSCKLFGDDTSLFPVVHYVSVSSTKLKIKHNYSRNSLFLSSIVEWNKLSQKVGNSENIRVLKNVFGVY